MGGAIAGHQLATSEAAGRVVFIIFALWKKGRYAVDDLIDERFPRGVGAPADDGAALHLAGPDTLHLSHDLGVSDAVRKKLDDEKQLAQAAAATNAVHCPDWLGAQVHPHGSRGGYSHLIETEDFTVKVLGPNIPLRPGLFLELRSNFLHTHPEGPKGACEEALCWVREQLLYDQDEELVRKAVSFAGVKLSRADLHADWQGGWVPSPADIGRFLKPARVKWNLFHDGVAFTGVVFGRGALQARIYNKSHEARGKGNDAYFALLKERAGEAYDPARDVWRLEFQLRREGATGFRLYRAPETTDGDADIDAELSAEELPHLGTLPRLFVHLDPLWRHLTTHTLRLVMPDGQRNRARWSTDPTWEVLQDDFARVANADPLDEDSRAVVRGARYDGKRRLLRRMLLGVVDSLEVEDAAPASAALASLSRWVDAAVRREAERAAERKSRYAERYGSVPRWVERGMGARLERAEQVRHRVQMLLGICSARGVLPLELKPAHNVADLLEQHLDDLEAEADAKGGLAQVLADHFSKVYKVSAPRDLFAVG